MKTHIKKTTLLLILLFPFLSQAEEDINGINKQIDALASIFSDGIAVTYPEFRVIKYGQIFESTNDAVVFFSIEGFNGGNVHIEYIAFFSEIEKIPDEPRQKAYRLISVKKIGGRGWRTFDWRSAKIKNGTIEVPVTAYKSSDPMCCPSLEGISIFTPSNSGEILEKI